MAEWTIRPSEQCIHNEHKIEDFPNDSQYVATLTSILQEDGFPVAYGQTENRNIMRLGVDRNAKSFLELQSTTRILAKNILETQEWNEIKSQQSQLLALKRQQKSFNVIRYRLKMQGLDTRVINRNINYSQTRSEHVSKHEDPEIIKTKLKNLVERERKKLGF